MQFSRGRACGQPLHARLQDGQLQTAAMTGLAKRRFTTNVIIPRRKFSLARSIGWAGTRAPLWWREAFGSIICFSTVRTNCSAITGDFLTEMIVSDRP